jgi:hypothetical protein
MSKRLRHIVLIQFKETVSRKEFKYIEERAATLKEITGVNDLLFGENVSSEKLNKEYSHCLSMWFTDEEDRDKVYLPHPIHQKFVQLFVPFTENVLVFDFWE